MDLHITYVETCSILKLLNRVTFNTRLVRSYRDTLFLKFIGIDDPCSPNSNVLKKIDAEGEDFYCEMSCLMKKIKLALHELRGFVSDKYADSMANTSGCITQ